MELITGIISLYIGINQTINESFDSDVLPNLSLSEDNKIDIVKYSENPEEFIASALSPAKNVTVNIVDPEKKEALAIVSEDNLSLAIGKKGSNIKLASRLTKYKIEIKTLAQITAEGNQS